MWNERVEHTYDLEELSYSVIALTAGGHTPTGTVIGARVSCSTD
jgi:hypothetical protein